MTERKSVAIHEGGHVLALLSRGVVPTCAWVDDHGHGAVEFPRGVGAETQALAALAGAVAVRALTDCLSEFPSETDEQLFTTAARNMGRTDPKSVSKMRESIESFAAGLVVSHSDAIGDIAAALETRGKLNREAIGRLCRVKNSLRHFRHLVPLPKQKPVRPSRPVVAMGAASPRRFPVRMPWETGMSDFWRFTSFENKAEFDAAMGIAH